MTHFISKFNYKSTRVYIYNCICEALGLLRREIEVLEIDFIFYVAHYNHSDNSRKPQGPHIEWLLFVPFLIVY